MKILFTNIVKNTLPLLINANTEYTDYVDSLTSASKRFLNLSYRHFDNKIESVLGHNIRDLKNINTINIDLECISKENFTNSYKKHLFVKFYENKSIIAYNYTSVTKSKITHCYCNCPVHATGNLGPIFNNFSWFKFIELIIKSKQIDLLDLVVDRRLYNFIKIHSNQIYDYNDIMTLKKYLNNRIKSNGFDENNSSKFLFLTKNDKANYKDYISAVCVCGHKNIIDITLERNNCYSCNKPLTKLI